MSPTGMSDGWVGVNSLKIWKGRAFMSKRVAHQRGFYHQRSGTPTIAHRVCMICWSLASSMAVSVNFWTRLWHTYTHKIQVSLQINTRANPRTREGGTFGTREHVDDKREWYSTDDDLFDGYGREQVRDKLKQGLRDREYASEYLQDVRVR
jgi:hypothetical protein